MSLIEGIGDEVTNFLIIVVSAIVIYLAWRSTNVRDERSIPRTAVVVIESYRRRLADRAVQHPVTISILRSASQHSNGSNDTEELELDDNSSANTNIERITEPPSLQLVLDEVSDLTSGATYPSHPSSLLTHTDDYTDIGPQEIIRDMDNDNNDDGIRRRRPLTIQPPAIDNNYPSTSRSTDNNNEEPITPSSTSILNQKSTLNYQDSTDKSENTDNCTNENSENGNVIENMQLLMNENTSAVPPPAAVNNNNSPPSKTRNTETIPNDTEFRIKLKYLNDDLKLVKGTPNEAIGDFKKRNFNAELSNQKVVRLVFNGHVLQPDTKTLQACGLFDNCVVHCLVHNQRPNVQQSARNENNSSNDGSADNGVGLENGAENNEVIFNNGQRIVYFGMMLLCVALVFLWYFRIQYFQLFTWYSTIGLFLLTALFLIIIPLVYLIETDITV